MNENIDLIKILENCPKGFPLYSIIYGTVTFSRIVDNAIEFMYSSRFLLFQSAEIAQEFLDNFRYLIEQAGDLI